MLRSRSLLNLGHDPYSFHMGLIAVGCNLTEMYFGVFLAVPTCSVRSNWLSIQKLSRDMAILMS